MDIVVQIKANWNDSAKIRTVNSYRQVWCAWWRHQMEILSASLALCARNSPVTGEFPSQRPVTRSSTVFSICAWRNSWVNNRYAGDLRRHRANCDVTVMFRRVSFQSHPHLYKIFSTTVQWRHTSGVTSRVPDNHTVCSKACPKQHHRKNQCSTLLVFCEGNLRVTGFSMS